MLCAYECLFDLVSLCQVGGLSQVSDGPWFSVHFTKYEVKWVGRALCACMELVRLCRVIRRQVSFGRGHNSYPTLAISWRALFRAASISPEKNPALGTWDWRIVWLPTLSIDFHFCLLLWLAVYPPRHPTSLPFSPAPCCLVLIPAAREAPWKSMPHLASCPFLAHYPPKAPISQRESWGLDGHMVSPPPPTHSASSLFLFLEHVIALLPEGLCIVFSLPAFSSLRYLYESLPHLSPVVCVWGGCGCVFYSNSALLFWPFFLLYWKLHPSLQGSLSPWSALFFHLNTITSSTI